MIFYMDEAGVGLLLSVGSAYARKGNTPVIAHKCQYKHLCVISAISDTGRMRWALHPDAFKGTSIVQFLENILAAVARKILVIWDGRASTRGGGQVFPLLVKE